MDEQLKAEALRYGRLYREVYEVVASQSSGHARGVHCDAAEKAATWFAGRITDRRLTEASTGYMSILEELVQHDDDRPTEGEEGVDAAAADAAEVSGYDQAGPDFHAAEVDYGDMVVPQGVIDAINRAAGE